ncbi:MAG: DNA polymerase Y family protein [Pseudomonadota bacterium]|nr:DNA polymerase Y family protein [Pseudomonadota bacterium]
MLWIALHLPALSLESFAATLAARESLAAGQPIALLEAHHIVSANTAAQAEGVKPGLKRATALALAPRIVLGQADATRDAAALWPIAHAALAFTPSVSLQPASLPGAAANTVLLEVRASLRYFGGLERLLHGIDVALSPLGHAVRVATAATAQGAALLVQIEPPPRCLDLVATRLALAEAPVWLLGPGREHWEALQGMGLRKLGDLLQLPRAGLARRFSEAMLVEIDAAFGNRPDPREPIVLPPSFESRLELFARADTTEQVLHGAGVLLERLIAWLSAQHAFVRRFRLLMHHESRRSSSSHTGDCTAQPTVLEIALAEPSRDSAHLLVLLRERLAHVQLPAPTLELYLQAEDISKRAPPNVELFATSGSEHEGLTRLIERLQARLGAGQVQRLCEVEDHRPERASESHSADAAALGSSRKSSKKSSPAKRARPAEATPAGEGAAVLAAALAPRPVWLQPPEPLAEQGSRPLFEGRSLQLLSGPERIEAGWWDAGLAGRDYFIAETAEGALVWIYRERIPLAREGGENLTSGSGWFLQGRFG